MKRLQLVLLVAALCSTSAAAETTAAAGGGVTFNSSSAVPISPTVVSTIAGDLAWLPTDSIGAFLDWSAAGSYEPVAGTATAIAAATVSSSYVSEKFLGKVSISSAADFSTTDPFYGASSAELLLSYGSPAFSVFAAPRFSFVEDSGISMDAGGRVGFAVLYADKLLVKPSFEAGVSVPGGLATGWYVTPSISLSWYVGGGSTIELTGGYSRSYSTRLTPLTTGGQPLPLDTYRGGFLATEVTWVGTRGTTLTARLPVSYSKKTYDAYAGGVSLGAPAWLVALEPTAQVSLPMTDSLDLVFTIDGTFDFSNNSVEQNSALIATTQIQLHLD